jgi:hypothetical protein
MKFPIIIGLVVLTHFYPIFQGFSQVALTWNLREDINKDLPNAIQVSDFQGLLPNSQRKVYIVIAKINLKDKNLDLKSISSQNGKGLEITPDLAVKNGAILAINGGYFTFKPDTTHEGLSSVSLLVSEGETIATNQTQVVRKNKEGKTMICYPTRSAFGIRKNKMDVAWVYSQQGKNYFYKQPNPITDAFEQAKPTQKQPSKRKKWKMTEVMGGGPVLVENYAKKITDKEELFSQIAGVNPRTAVGYTDQQEVIFMVIDGRQEISEGVTFEELSDIFLGLGVKEAINLDGGGSSTFWVNGQVLNHPSDKTGLRKVASVLIVKKKSE